MSSGRLSFTALALSLSIFSSSPAWPADPTCNNLVPSGAKMICPGFEPNWAVELICDGEQMSADFVDAFSGDDIVTTPGSVSFLSEKPWAISTSHGIKGLIAYTPGACQDESDRFFDFTLTTTALPDYSDQVAPICCRIE